MKFAVDLRTCENYGQCTYVAPDHFALDDDGQLTLRSQAENEYVSSAIGADDAAGVEQAVGVCPMQAIRIVD